MLLKAVSEQSIEDILFHAEIKKRSNNIEPILSEKVIRFYNNNKISLVGPHKNATVLVKNSDGTKERVCSRILEKTIETTYHSFCNENPECSIKLRKFGKLRPWNVTLTKLDSVTISCNEKLCDNILREESNIKCYHQKCTDCKAKSLTCFKNLKGSSKCYVENFDCHAQNHVINFKQF